MIKLLLILLLSSTCLLSASARFGLKTTKGEPLELLELKTKALVEGPYAEVQYIHTYKNPLDHAVETKFHFPRTDSSIFHKFEAVFQNQTIVGKIMEKQTAKRMYEWNTRRGSTVAYSERSQNAPDIMNIKAGNIPANETVEIVFSVIQPLETISNKFYELKLPVVLTERYSPAHTYHHDTPSIQTVDAKGSLYKEWNIQVELKSNTPFAILANPTHLLKPKLSEQSSGTSSKIYKAVWNVTVVPNKDFVIYFGPEKLEKPETILATYPQDPNNHVLLMNFIPDLNTVESKVAQQLLETDDGLLRLKKMAYEYDIEHAQAEFIFVIDRSGSMMGSRIANLRKALAKFLSTIPKNSYFNIVSFGSIYELYKHQSVLNSPQALKDAREWVNTIEANMGGTMILDSLKHITHSLKKVADVPKIVMILTDGDVFNPDEVINHISANANKMRFCSVGIGYGASDYLVRNMAKAGKCRSEFVQDHEDIGDKALYMVQAAISQYITDVRFDIGCFNDRNQKVYSDKVELDLLLKDQAFSKWIYLENIVNLKSCQATLAYYSSLKVKRVTEEMDIQRYELEEVTNFWHKVAYDAKIKELEQTIKKGRNWNQENIKTQIIELSTKYQVLSDEISFLAVIQESTVNPNEQAQQINIPNMKSADYTVSEAELEKAAKMEERSERAEEEEEDGEEGDDSDYYVCGDTAIDVDVDVDVDVDFDVDVDVDMNVSITRDCDEEEEEEEEDTAKPKELEIQETPADGEQQQDEHKKKDDDEHEEGVGKLVSAEDANTGQVTGKTYLSDLQEMGGFFPVFLMIIIFISNELASIAYGIILSQWAAEKIAKAVSIGIMAGITVYVIIIHIIKNIVFTHLLLKASHRYHDKIFNRIVRNPVSFFDTNPLGRILNRFSNDIGVLDKFLPATLTDVADQFFMILILVIMLAYIRAWLLIPIFIGVIGIFCMVKLCYEAIKQSRRYELISRSPLYSLISASLSGMIIIISYKQNDSFKNKFRTFMHDNTKGSVAFWSCSRFFGFFVDLIYLSTGIANIFILTALSDNVGLTAFGLVLILSITSILQYGLRQLVQSYVLMASVERLRTYCELPTEAPLELPEDESLKNEDWPQNGEITLNMKYRENTDYIIRDLSLHAQPGEKIGCIGRTGAGKSFIIQTLFRMVEIDKKREDTAGGGVKIDGVKTKEVGLHLLRNSISIIPQTPFIFSGTIRKNLDPLGVVSHERLWEVLEDVGLKRQVEELEKKLYTDMTNAASVFSVGQKQLICLARTILKRSKVIVLDEPTANGSCR